MFTFVELEPFTRVRDALLDDAEFARLQFHLMAEPEAMSFRDRAGAASCAGQPEVGASAAGRG